MDFEAPKLWKVGRLITYLLPYQTSSFTIPKLPQLHKIRRSADFEVLKFWKGSSGSNYLLQHMADCTKDNWENYT